MITILIINVNNPFFIFANHDEKTLPPLILPAGTQLNVRRETRPFHASIKKLRP
jgi:hypothetical protein